MMVKERRMENKTIKEKHEYGSALCIKVIGGGGSK